VEQLEQRIRDMEAESSANLAALEQRSRDLEEQLQHTTSRNENEGSIAKQEVLEQRTKLERLEMQIRDLEAEKLAGEFHLKSVQAQVEELEAQLQLTAGRIQSEGTMATDADTPSGEATKMESAVAASAELLRRAEWITGCAIGAIRPLGVVAAEAYAVAAFAADPQNLAASQLLAELTKLRRSSIERLPSVIEAVASFDQGAAGFFGSDSAANADLAEREAQRRYHAGLDRSALLALNMSLALRQQTGGDESKGMQKLQEMKTMLLERLGDKV
jgi:DNA repair exonuclease SbcCD ATPase subunit